MAFAPAVTAGSYTSVTADNQIAVIDSQSLKVVRRQPVDGKFPFWIAVPGNP